MPLLGMCGVCHKEITVHEVKSQECMICPDCGKKHYIGKREGALTTARCGCGTILIEEGGGLRREYPNKK